jgi:photosystem II stability/assembly factor-like uncharacterized protein
MPFPHISIYSLKNILLILCLLNGSCKKSELTIESLKVVSGTEADLTSINILNDTLYITGNSGIEGIIICSTDKGYSWITLKDDFEQGINDICRHDNSVFLAADSFTVYRSDDSGISWYKQWIQGVISIEYMTDVKCISSAGSRIYMCGGQDLGHGFAGVSTDNGSHWKFLESEHELKSIAFADDMNGVCVGYGALYSTSDGGETWSGHNSYGAFWTSVYYSGSSYFACSYSGDVIQSVDGIKWNFLRSAPGTFGSKFFLNSIYCNGSSVFSAGLNGRGILSSDFGNNWKNIIFAEEPHIYAIFIQEEGGIAAGEKGMILRFSY